MMTRAQLVALLMQYPADAVVHLGVSFVRDSAEDEGYAYGPAMAVEDFETVLVGHGLRTIPCAARCGFLVNADDVTCPQGHVQPRPKTSMHIVIRGAEDAGIAEEESEAEDDRS